MNQNGYAKLVPEPTPETAPYWDGLSEQRLMLQKCGNCGKVRHYPRPVCDACHSMDVDWIEAKGTGKIYSWTVTHHAFHPGYKTDLPYILVTVELEEGVRLQAPLDADWDTRLNVDMPVVVGFDRATPELTLPFFTLAKSAG